MAYLDLAADVSMQIHTSIRIPLSVYQPLSVIQNAVVCTTYVGIPDDAYLSVYLWLVITISKVITGEE